MAEKFENILDECIERLLRGESVEQCVQRYPQHAEQLKPLLQVALAAQKASSVEPRPEFKAQVRYQLRSLLHDKKEKKQPSKLPVWGWLPRWATAVIIAALVFLLAGGTVAASSDSLPGEVLYPVKLGAERVQDAWTFSSVGKAMLQAKFVCRRAEEMAQLAERGNLPRLEQASARFEAHLQKIEELAARIKQEDQLNAAQVTAMKQQLWRNAVRDMAALEIVEGNVPAPCKPVINHARGRLEEAYGAALNALNGQANGLQPS